MDGWGRPSGDARSELYIQMDLELVAHSISIHRAHIYNIPVGSRFVAVCYRRKKKEERADGMVQSEMRAPRPGAGSY